MTSQEQIIIGIVSFLFFLLVHVLVWQNDSIKYRGIYLMWKIAALSYVAMSSLGLLVYSFSINEHMWTSGPLNFCLVICYMHLYVGVEKSISIRIIGELVKDPSKTLTLNELEKTYSPKKMVKPRLKLLSEKKWLLEENGKYHCLKTAEKLVKINIFLKKPFLLGKTG